MSFNDSAVCLAPPSSASLGLEDHFHSKIEEFSPNLMGIDFRSRHIAENKVCKKELELGREVPSVSKISWFTMRPSTPCRRCCFRARGSERAWARGRENEREIDREREGGREGERAPGDGAVRVLSTPPRAF